MLEVMGLLKNDAGFTLMVSQTVEIRGEYGGGSNNS